ncbi:hypothetical protein [Heyndrickxia oleronia]|uniref:hypothetical protein n=1 Tax=Heyndrickxia oleronia TaxID=38875 RepID=UPI001C0F34BF|nr:hypothetical protein [Heyndrickxia oleronia]MBU5214573.1 hypothetical protein [Heyndrickxia oleronia]
MRLAGVRRKLSVGCYCTISPPNKGLAINMSLNCKWYAWPFMMWKVAHNNYSFKWYQYPRLLFLIAYHSFCKWMGINA